MKIARVLRRRSALLVYLSMCCSLAGRVAFDAGLGRQMLVAISASLLMAATVMFLFEQRSAEACR